MAAASSPIRYESSPNVSLTRPQRRSRAMHSTGENVQWTPVAATSTALTRATCSARPRSQVPAMPNWVGKIVAPSQNECPWMQSSPTSNGIPSRVCSTFSSAVIRRSRSATRSATAAWALWKSVTGVTSKACHHRWGRSTAHAQRLTRLCTKPNEVIPSSHFGRRQPRRQRFHRRLRHARQGRGRPDRVRRRAPAALAQTVVEQHEEGHYGERRYLSETSMRKLIDLKKARGSAALLVPQP